jgi:hypothetical protein
MPRLPSLLSAICVLGAAVLATLYFQTNAARKLVEQQLADTTAHAAKLEADLATAHSDIVANQAKLAASESHLAVIKTKLGASEARGSQIERELTQAKSVVAIYEQTSRALSDEIAALRRDLDAARASTVPPEVVSGYKSTIAELERQLALTQNGAAAPTAAGASTAVFTNRSTRATVLTVGPENAFVVLNFGSARGAALGQKLNVNQGTDVVATVLISDVRDNFSIAQVLPDTLRAVLQKGDSAILLR